MLLSISIHAPLAGSDQVLDKAPNQRLYAISIHAPLAGSDSKNTQKALKRIERNAQSVIFVFPSSAIGFFPPPFVSRESLAFSCSLGVRPIYRIIGSSGM